MNLVDVLYEDSDLLVVNKPAGLVCHPTKGDEYSSLISRARLYLGGAAHLVNRLDRETSGVVLVAKNETAAGELGRLIEGAAVQKHYLAIVHGYLLENQCTIEACLGKDLRSSVAIKDCVRPEGAAARTRVNVLGRFVRATGEFSLLQVLPLNGRKHQIRIHLAHIGHPIVGDKIYGRDESIYLRFVSGQLTAADQSQLLLPNHALHAGRVEFSWRARDWRLSAPPPREFMEFLPDAQNIDLADLPVNVER